MSSPNSSSPDNYRSSGRTTQRDRSGSVAAGLKNFLPLSENNPHSRRPASLLYNRSNTALYDSLRKSESPMSRRGSRQPATMYQDNEPDLERAFPQADIHVSGDGRGIDMDFGFEPPTPPSDFPLTRSVTLLDERGRRSSYTPTAMNTPQMRSQRLIGNSNPRYKWERYYKSEDDLKKLKKPVRQYYERNNYLIQQYLYIDRLLDSSLPHNLLQEYHASDEIVDVPPTIEEESNSAPPTTPLVSNGNGIASKVKRTPKDIYKVSNEITPLLGRDGTHDDRDDEDAENGNQPVLPDFEPDEDLDSNDRIVKIAIYINFAANALLLILKVIVTVLTSSLSVLASLVDAALDFLSTFIVWTTGKLISSGDQDRENYPVGRRRLEPLGVLVFSVIMITSFFQVAMEAFKRLTSRDPAEHVAVQLTPMAIGIMASTVLVKGLCWLWCRFIRNSSVQALAQDAVTDMVFNTFSIIFPLVGYYANIWFLDPLGGLLLSLYVIISWGTTTRTHIANLTGHAASKDERNILLYLTMRFAHTITHIQGLAAYHAGDKLNVEVDIVLNEGMSLRDSHDLGESLQYVLESVPGVERAFVHADYRSVNIPTHMKQ